MEDEIILRKISEQMDVLISLFKLAYKDRIGEERKNVLEDKVMEKILEIVPEDLSSTELIAKVCKEVKQKDRAIRYRLSELIDIGVLKVERVGNKSYYRLTGII